MLVIRNFEAIKYESDGNDDEVIIPDGITWISRDCFCGTNVRSVVIPDSVTVIEDRAFYFCNSLESIRLPAHLKIISERCFYSCISLRSIEIPPDVYCISNSAFFGCSSLETVIMNKGLKKIGCDAFGLCTALKKAELPDTVEILEDYAFSYDSGIESFSFPASLTRLTSSTFINVSCSFDVSPSNPAFTAQDGALYDKKMSRLIKWPAANKNAVIPEGVRDICDHAFSQIRGLFSVELPEGVKRIGESAFSECRELSQIRLPCSLKSIGSRAFASTALKSITIPANTVTAGSDIFEDCKSLEAVEIEYCGVFTGDIIFSERFICRALAVREQISGDDYEITAHADLIIPVVLYHFKSTHERSAYEFIRMHSSDFMLHSVRSNNLYNIQIMLSQKGLIKKRYIDKYIEAALLADDRRIYTALIDYKNKYFGFSGDDFSV